MSLVRIPLKIFVLRTSPTSPKGESPRSCAWCTAECERKSDVTVLYSWSVDGFLLRVLALSSSANFRICNLLYTYAKVCFHWFDQSVEQKLICVFFYWDTSRTNLILQVHFTFMYLILQFSILGKQKRWTFLVDIFPCPSLRVTRC